MAYTTQTKVENYLTFNIDSVQSGQIAAWIALAKKWIDNYTGTTFEQGAAADRHFDGDGTREIAVDEFTGTPTVVFLDENGDVSDTLASTDFLTFPYNETVKNRIILSDGGTSGPFPKGVRRVRVTATWGQSSVPEPVEMAATKIVAQLVRDGIKGGKVASERLGEYSVAFEAIDEFKDVLGIKDLLWPYKVMDL